MNSLRTRERDTTSKIFQRNLAMMHLHISMAWIMYTLSCWRYIVCITHYKTHLYPYNVPLNAFEENTNRTLKAFRMLMRSEHSFGNRIFLTEGRIIVQTKGQAKEKTKKYRKQMELYKSLLLFFFPSKDKRIRTLFTLCAFKSSKFICALRRNLRKIETFYISFKWPWRTSNEISMVASHHSNGSKFKMDYKWFIASIVRKMFTKQNIHEKKVNIFYL